VAQAARAMAKIGHGKKPVLICGFTGGVKVAH